MKTAFAVAGAFHIIMFCLGLLGVVDYHLCFGEVGKCIPCKVSPRQATYGPRIQSIGPLNAYLLWTWMLS